MRARYALPIVLMLAAIPSIAFGESLVCQPIRRGESAAQVARRITGDSRNTYRASFQIMNPASRFVPKSQYDRIRAGWRACVLKPAVDMTASNTKHITVPAETPVVSDVSAVSGPLEGTAAPERASAGVLGVASVGRIDLTMVWLGAAMVVPWFGWRMIDEYLARKKTASFVMRHFAERFVHEFERPLIRHHAADRAVRSRLHYSARRGRFHILLAPGKGRRYPNLTDHKKNVEYDVARVLDVLADRSFECGPLSMHAGWIVVPFRFTAGSRQSGVACISSL